MNIKSVSGIAYRVKDIDATANFYQSLGFREGKKDSRSTSVYLNWFWVEFYCEEGGAPVSEARDSIQEALLYLSVDDVAAVYRELEEKGFNPSPEVLNKTRGRRETSISDPDGYRLVFFQKK